MRKAAAGLLIGLPVLFLAAYLVGVPVYVPAFLLPRRVLVAGELDAEELFALLGRHRGLVLLRGGEVIAVRQADYRTAAELDALLGPAAEPAALARYLPRLPEVAGPWSRLRLVLPAVPHAEELEAVQELQRSHRLPVELEVPELPYRPLFMGFSYTHSAEENSLDLELQFSSQVRRYDHLRVYRDDHLVRELAPAQLEAGTELRQALPASDEVRLRVELEGRPGRAGRTLRVRCPPQQEPQVLVISARPQAASFLERLWRVKKVTLEQALGEQLPRYPLLVLDGLPLRSLGGELSSVLSDLHQRGASSLLFVADSPGFGRKGDNPPIERMLPTELTPRSLQYLPDLSILIMLDVSASMMGDKLSLAKVSTLELVKNLKDTDRVSLLCFWDKYRFLHDFQDKQALDTEVQIAPLAAEGGTDLHPALAEGLLRLAGLASVAQKHVIILSDGKTREADFQPLIRRAVSAQISISTVAVGEDVDAELLSGLARGTGGRAYRVLSLDEIPSVIFEDRRQIARSSFAAERFAIRDFAGRPAGEVTGMSLFAPKSGAEVLFRNQFEDPLLAVGGREGALVMMFLSDLYGRYSGGFFSQPAAARTLLAVLEGVLRPGPLKLRVGEAAGKMSFTVSAEGLLRPALHLYRNNRLLQVRPLREGPLRLYSGGFLPPSSGEYVAVLYDRGAPVFRLPVFYNGTLEGRETDAEAALRRYRPLPFRGVSAGGLYLVLGFLASVAVTFLSRRLRTRGGGRG